MRCFLFLQGPHGSFFRKLGRHLESLGAAVIRVNLCGGDFIDWPSGSINYRGRNSDWSLWIAKLMNERQVTDLMVYGDWRPHHREAVHIARLRGISIWAFDEGYLRPKWITMEMNGVNGNSSLPKTPEEIRKILPQCIDLPDSIDSENPFMNRQILGFRYAAFSVLGLPFFPFYRTHRPYGHLKEMLCGWIPRIFSSRRRRRSTNAELTRLGNKPYILFPLQLDSDSQVRRYSPFSGMKEAIAFIMTSFAKNAPKDICLLIRNHPLDNGLIRYDRFISNFSKACGIADRIFFTDDANKKGMLEQAQAVVLLNSTMGMTALAMNKPVFCVGKAIYAMPGLAQNTEYGNLDDFWSHPQPPDPHLLEQFQTVVTCKALVNGNYYFGSGQTMAIHNCAKRLLAIN
ncbi:MAG: capsular biosynthesis protein [Desulfovibrionaceae bacterium]|nr:capsular biosynthesis protein [Desulfovibrionaceae bacterium]